MTCVALLGMGLRVYGVTLVTKSVVPVPPKDAHAFLATPVNWPKVVLSSHAVSGTADLTRPIAVGEVVDEIFGAPPILPLRVSWTCAEADCDRGVLKFVSPEGLAGVARNCEMSFTITTAEQTSADVVLTMSYEPVSPIARLATPLLALDNALALKLALPGAVRGT